MAVLLKGHDVQETGDPLEIVTLQYEGYHVLDAAILGEQIMATVQEWLERRRRLALDGAPDMQTADPLNPATIGGQALREEFDERYAAGGGGGGGALTPDENIAGMYQTADGGQIVGLTPEGALPAPVVTSLSGTFATLGEDGKVRPELLPPLPANVVTTDIDGNLPAEVLESLEGPFLPRDQEAGLAPLYRPAAPLIDARVIFTARAGHGWTLTSNGTSTATEDLTRRGPFSDRSIRIAKGTEHAELASPVLDPTVDLNDGPLTVWVYLPDTSPRGVIIRAHSGANDWQHFYQWERYGVPAADSSSPHIDGWTAFELFLADATPVGSPDPAAINRIKARTTVDNHTIWVGGIVQRPLPAEFPNGVCTIYFDDGYASTYERALPILARYGMAGVVSTIVANVGTPGYMTLAQLHELQERAGWEIAGHSYSPDAPENRFPNLSADELEAEFLALRSWLARNGFQTDTWVSPGGQSSPAVWAVGRRYFALHRTVAGQGAGGVRQGSAWTSPRPMYPAAIPSPNFDTTTMTVANLRAVLDGIKANRSWGSLTFHHVTAGASSGGTISAADLDNVLGYAASIGVPIRTPGQVLRATGGR